MPAFPHFIDIYKKTSNMNIVERFLKYVSFDTQSAEDTGRTPSTEKQFALARHLEAELKALGMEDVELDENGYLYATLPANTDKPLPVIGFIAHMEDRKSTRLNSSHPK